MHDSYNTYTSCQIYFLIVFDGNFSSIIYFKQLCNKKFSWDNIGKGTNQKRRRGELFDSVYDEIHADFLAIVG